MIRYSTSLCACQVSSHYVLSGVGTAGWQSSQVVGIGDKGPLSAVNYEKHCDSFMDATPLLSKPSGLWCQIRECSLRVVDSLWNKVLFKRRATKSPTDISGCSAQEGEGPRVAITLAGSAAVNRWSRPQTTNGLQYPRVQIHESYRGHLLHSFTSH